MSACWAEMDSVGCWEECGVACALLEAAAAEEPLRLCWRLPRESRPVGARDGRLEEADEADGGAGEGGAAVEVDMAGDGLCTAAMNRASSERIDANAVKLRAV